MIDLIEARPCGTDETACGRCGDPTTRADSWPWGRGGRICIPCVEIAAEQQLLQRAAG